MGPSNPPPVSPGVNVRGSLGTYSVALDDGERKTSERLIPCILLLGELDLRIDYNKGKNNMQTDSFSRLLTLRSRVKPIDEDIGCFFRFDSKYEVEIAPREIYWHEKRDEYLVDP